MECNTRREAQEAGISSLKQLQQRLIAGDRQFIQKDESQRCYLEILRRRLERVKGWGGGYAQINFSDQVKEILTTDHDYGSAPAKSRNQVFV